MPCRAVLVCVCGLQSHGGVTSHATHAGMDNPADVVERFVKALHWRCQGPNVVSAATGALLTPGLPCMCVGVTLKHVL